MEAEGPRLRKSLTLLDVFMLGVTGMIGSAWLFSVLGAAGAMGPSAIFSWIIAGVFFIVMVFGFAELGGLFPFSGSLARYNHYTHGTISNYLLAWTYFIGSVTTVSSEAVAVVEYSSAYIPWAWNSKLDLLTPLGVAVAAGIVLLFFAVQLIGVHVYGWLNRFLTAWKLIIPTLTFILIFLMYFKPENITKVPGGLFPFGTAAVFSGLITTGIVYAYEGFRQGLEYAGETKNPQRDVPLGTILALAVVIAIYVLLQIAFIGGINWSKAGVSFGNWTALSSAWQAHPFYSELTAAGIPLLAAFAVLLLIDAIVSPAGTLGAYIGTTARNLYGMARVNYIPKFFGDIHKGFRTPWIALIVSTIIAIIFLLPFPTWYAIMSLSATATVYNYLTVGVTNHALRRLSPSLRRPYRPPAWYIVYPLSFIMAALFIYWSSWTYVNVIIELAVIGLPLLLLGPYRNELNLTRARSAEFSAIYWAASAATIAAYWLKLSRMSLTGFAIYWGLLSSIQVLSLAALWMLSKGHGDVKGAVWLIAFNIGIGIISFIGSLGPLPSPLIPYPWDYVAAAVFSLGVYFLGVYTSYKTKDLAEVELHGLRAE